MLAIADELTENGFVLRYRTDETDDGTAGRGQSKPRSVGRLSCRHPRGELLTLH